MIYLDIGRREQGKTTLGYYMVQRVTQRAIFDPRAMIRPGGARSVVVRADIELAPAFDALQDREIDEIIYTPPGNVQDGFALFSSELYAWVAGMPARPLGILVDEAGFVNLEIDHFLWVLRCSRRDVVMIVVTCHRPIDISTSIRAIADTWLLFPMRQEHDLRIIEQRCSPAVARQLEKLKPRQFVLWDDARAEWKLYGDPTRWYVRLADPVASTDAASPLSDIPESPTVKQSGLFP